MKDVLYATANLLRELNERDDRVAQATMLEALQRAVSYTPGPRIARVCSLFELMAVDAPPTDYPASTDDDTTEQPS